MIIVGSGSYQIAQEVTADPASINSGAVGAVSLSVAGAVPGMCFSVSAPSLETGLGIIHATCTTAGTVAIRILNASGSTVNPASQTFRVVGF